MSPTSTARPRNVIPADQLRLELTGAGIPDFAIWLGDAAYLPPARDWLVGDFYRWFHGCIGALGVSSYRREAWDCEDFADLFAAFARICHRRTSPDSRAGLPVGILYYVREAGGGHAINVALTSDHGVTFIEPQNGELLSLTPAEKASTWLLKI
jgi:hypothetical protein